MDPITDPNEAFFNVKIDKERLVQIQQKYQQTPDADAFGATEEFLPFILSDGDDEGPSGTKEPKKNNNTKRIDEDSKRHKKSPPPPPTTRPLINKPPRIKTLLRWDPSDAPWLLEEMQRDKHRNPYNTSNNSHRPIPRHYIHPTERLHQEIVQFVNFVSPTEEERYARHCIVERVREVVEKLWPGATLQVFGSFHTQLYLPSSDIDLVVFLPDKEQAAGSPIRKLARALQKTDMAEPGSIKTIPRARVPIVKYLDRKTNLEIDVSFNIDSGVHSARIMQQHLDRFPALRPLVLLMKQFLEQRGLNEVFTGGIGSYTTMCLIVSFLQMHPLVQAGFVRPHENLGVMLLEFFELYGKNFNYEVVGISLLDGGFYYSKAERGWLQEQRPHLLSIEDPQNPEADIAKASFAFGSVRQAFDHAHNVLVAAIAEYSQWQRSAEDSRRSVGECPSILASVVRLSEKVLRHRYYIEQTTNL